MIVSFFSSPIQYIPIILHIVCASMHFATVRFIIVRRPFKPTSFGITSLAQRQLLDWNTASQVNPYKIGEWLIQIHYKLIKLHRTKYRIFIHTFQDIYRIFRPTGVLKSELGSYSYAFYLTGVLQVIASISTCLTYGISNHRAQRHISMAFIGSTILNNLNALT